MLTTKLISIACPFCGKQLDRATCPKEDAAPVEGDLTVCVGCGGVMVFGKELVLRRASQEELDELDDVSRLNLVRVSQALKSHSAG